MMRAPLVLAVFYCLGIVLANLIRFSFWPIMGLAAVIFAGTILLPRNNFAFWIPVLFLALLAGALNLKNSRILPKEHINNFVPYQDNALYSLSGFIDSQPELKDRHLQFIFRVQEAKKDKLKWPSCGKLLVKLSFTRKLNYGDNLIIIGNLTRPYNFFGKSGYKGFLARQGIYLIMRLDDPRKIIQRPGNSGSKLISNALWLRAKMEGVIRRNLTDLPAGILCAMVLGQKRGISWLVNNAFVRSGTVHILVVSGFNVGIVAFIINLLLKVLRFRRIIRIILTIVCLFTYCLITGSSDPVMRATLMGIIFLSAYLFKRSPDIYNSLAISALFILVINPSQLFDIGFQLSFISVLAIVYLYPKLEMLIGLRDCKYKIWRFISQGCLVSFSAWIATLGIIIFNFGIIAPVTVLANILVVPLATLITLCGFTLVLSGLISPALAHLISIPTSMFINLLLNINALLIKLPLAYICL